MSYSKIDVELGVCKHEYVVAKPYHLPLRTDLKELSSTPQRMDSVVVDREIE